MKAFQKLDCNAPLFSLLHRMHRLAFYGLYQPHKFVQSVINNNMWDQKLEFDF